MSALHERPSAPLSELTEAAIRRASGSIQKLARLREEQKRVRTKLAHDLDELEKVDPRLARSLRQTR